MKLLMHSSDDVTCVALEALLAIFTNGNLEQKKVRIWKYSEIKFCLSYINWLNKQCTFHPCVS